MGLAKPASERGQQATGLLDELLTRARQSVAPAARLQRAPWLPLYVAVILAASFTPLSITREPSIALDQLPAWPIPSVQELMRNVLAYLPLGWALCRRPLVFVLFVALGLSTAVEVLQLWLLRTPTPWDVAANVTGVLLGARVIVWRGSWRLIEPRLRLLALPLCVASAVWILLIARNVHTLPPPGLASWQDLPLSLGAVDADSSAFAGALRRLHVYDRLLPDAAVRRARAPRPYADDGPIFSLETERGLVIGVDGPEGAARWPLRPPVGSGFKQGPRGLTFGERHLELPRSVARHIASLLRTTGKISVFAELEPGPTSGRIVSPILSSAEPGGRTNFALGQVGPAFFVVVRAPHDGPQRIGPHVAAQHAGAVRLLATSDGRWVRLVSSEGGRAEIYLPAVLPSSSWFVGEGLTVSLALAVALCALAAGALWPRPGVSRVLAIALGAVVGQSLLRATGVFAYHADNLLTVVLPTVAVSLAVLPMAAAFDGAQRLARGSRS